MSKPWQVPACSESLFSEALSQLVSAHNMIPSGVLGQWAYQVALGVKNPLANTGDIRDLGSVPRWGRSPGEGNANPLQHSCLENPMDRGA